MWSAEDFLKAHLAIRKSGLYNFEGCKISIPTKIRHDRMREALGEDITPHEERTLSLLQFGMPIDCNPEFGIKTKQKNHHSAVSYSEQIDDYLSKNISNQAILGPFDVPPIPDLCFSPLMSVPKEETKRRVIVDFSFPPGRSINDGIPRSSYLDFAADFCLPSVQTIVSRVNDLGRVCLLYKRDLKGAFRKFCIDPGDYRFTGLEWRGNVYVDLRLAMGLRSSAFCCQSVTELVAKEVGKKAHVLVYLDDFGGAELADKAQSSFEYLGRCLEHFGLEEAQEKAVAPTTEMDWLGISLNTSNWTMA